MVMFGPELLRLRKDTWEDTNSENGLSFLPNSPPQVFSAYWSPGWTKQGKGLAWPARPVADRVGSL